MLLRGLIALVLTLLATLPVAAQTAGWEFPASASYTAGAGDNGKILSSENAPGSAITVTLPNPATVGATWEMAFSTANGRGIIANVSAGFILAGQKSVTSFTAPSNTNYEYFALASDGTNFRVTTSTRATALQNGVLVAGPGVWTYLAATGFTAGPADNGTQLSSKQAGGAVTVTLPAAAIVPNGWTIGLNADTNPITLQPSGSGGSLVLLGGASAATYLIQPGRYAFVSFDGLGNFRVTQATRPPLLASEFGVSTTGANIPALAAANTAALNAMTQAAWSTGAPWFVDVPGLIPVNGMITYSGAGGSFLGGGEGTSTSAAGACLLMEQAGFGFFTMSSPTGSPLDGFEISHLDNLCIDMNRFDGSAIMFQGMNNATITNPRWYNVGLKTYTYNDGIANASYPDAGLTLKGVSTTGNGPIRNVIINARALLYTFLRPTACVGDVLSFSSVSGIYDTDGTVYVADTQTPFALAANTTVVSHTGTTVTLSGSCASVVAGDSIIFTTAAVNVEITTTGGGTRTLPSPETFIGGQFQGATIGIDDKFGGRNQFFGIDVGENCYGVVVGGNGGLRTVTSQYIEFAYGEDDVCAKVNMMTDSAETFIPVLGGTDGTAVEVIDNGTADIYPGHFYIGGGQNGGPNFVALTTDVGGLGTAGLRFRTDLTDPGGITCMPNAANLCELRLYGNDDVTGTNIGWAQLFVDPATNFLDLQGESKGTGVTPTQFRVLMPLVLPGLATISSGSHALCYNTATAQEEQSATTTCPP